MSLKVAQKLWTILLANLIDLSKFAIVEEDVVSTTVDTFDVHSKRHDDLKVRILRLVISHPYFYSFVRDLDHFEIIFHFLFENGVVQNHSSLFMKTGEYLLVTTPSQLSYWSSLCLNAWHSFPSIAISWTFSGKLLALPHDDVSIFGTTRNNPSSRVVLDRHYLVIEYLSFEGALCEREHIVLIIFNIEHSHHILSRYGSQETLSSPDCGQVIYIARDSKLHLSVRHQLFR